VTFKNVTIIPQDGAVFNLYNSRNISMENMPVSDDKLFMKLVGEKTDAIRLEDMDASTLTDRIEYGKGVTSRAVIWD
jgi:hypothetical protein